MHGGFLLPPTDSSHLTSQKANGVSYFIRGTSVLDIGNPTPTVRSGLNRDKKLVRLSGCGMCGLLICVQPSLWSNVRVGIHSGRIQFIHHTLFASPLSL